MSRVFDEHTFHFRITQGNRSMDRKNRKQSVKSFKIIDFKVQNYNNVIYGTIIQPEKNAKKP